MVAAFLMLFDELIDLPCVLFGQDGAAKKSFGGIFISATHMTCEHWQPRLSLCRAQPLWQHRFDRLQQSRALFYSGSPRAVIVFSVEVYNTHFSERVLEWTRFTAL